jgi:hypothetical protein
MEMALEIVTVTATIIMAIVVAITMANLGVDILSLNQFLLQKLSNK